MGCGHNWRISVVFIPLCGKLCKGSLTLLSLTGGVALMVIQSNRLCCKMGFLLFFILLALFSLGYAQPNINGCPELSAQHFKRTQLIGNSSGGQLLEPIQIAPYENDEGRVDIYFTERRGKIKGHL